jgi:hypothetical protein
MTEKFEPYCYYNKETDSIEVYFKDESCYAKPLNDQLDLHLSFDNEEVVGVNILNVKRLLENEGKFK